MRARHIGDVIQTEISDHGPGIEFPERIFEPFFTTKEERHGHGTGNLPLDRRVARWAIVGGQERTAWCDVYLHLAD